VLGLYELVGNYFSFLPKPNISFHYMSKGAAGQFWPPTWHVHVWCIQKVSVTCVLAFFLESDFPNILSPAAVGFHVPVWLNLTQALSHCRTSHYPGHFFIMDTWCRMWHLQQEVSIWNQDIQSTESLSPGWAHGPWTISLWIRDQLKWS
jgi:hypothetical protein